ncbi:hypothetical protein LR48_Vigan475s000700 [Vigna angularis]|uniref:Uncharacterized protein n=1 Tax=Phaseolus angularis TaxID=3914 RepID=A0A0L9TBJ7_PHAAN|nr:hypothetical protein LR48_Vigan475s000700 [Vigna angularis]
MESEKTSKSAKEEAATAAQRQFTAERHSGSHVGSAEGGAGAAEALAMEEDDEDDDDFEDAEEGEEEDSDDSMG